MPENKQRRRHDVVPIGEKNPNLPFHPGIRAGDFIFVSGQVPKGADGNMFTATIEEECRRTIESIRRVPRAGDADPRDIVRITVYLKDTRDFGRYNRAFAEFFPDGMLAHTTIQARAAINTKIEMDAIAYRPLAT